MAMAAARAAQPPAETQLERVHDEPGSVQFKYTSFAALGGGLTLGAGSSGTNGGGGAAAPLLVVEVARQQGVDPAAAAKAPALDDEPDEFISLQAPEPAKPTQQAPAAAGGVAGSLLDDYVNLGILQDPAAAAAAAAAKAAAAAAAASSRPAELKQVPWLPALKGIRSPLLRLHQEVVEFCRYLAPSQHEQEARQAAIDRIEEVVTGIWPKARVEVFGSFATGLYLPTSDVDAVIMGSGCTDIPQGLKALANALARKNMAKNMQVIAKAKVPIVKFEDAHTGYNFDISFDVANGPEAAENVRALMDSLPPMRPLVMVLKVFLQQRELNEVYSGGLGSYALLVMVAAFLQLHTSRQPPATNQRYGSSKAAAAAEAEVLEGSLGVLLVDFFRLYGRALNNVEVGVSCRKGGSYFNKRNKGFFQAERPFLYAVEDPNDASNDLGRNSFNISRVRMAFDWAYCQLIAPAEEGVSLLHRIIRLDPVLFLRAPPPPHTEELSPPPGLSKKKKKQQQQRQAAEEEGQQQEQPKRQKRRHRERSRSDDDAGAAAAGGGGGRGGSAAASGGRWEMEESDGEEQQEQQRRHKKKHKEHHHHHKEKEHKQHHHRQQQDQQQQPGGSKHIRFP